MARTEHQKELLAAYRERPITGAVCAVTDTVSGRTLLLASPNPAGQRNRFQFAVSTDMPLHPAMAADWRAHGGAAFTSHQKAFLERCAGAGYLTLTPDRLTLTPLGMIVQNSILEELI